MPQECGEVAIAEVPADRGGYCIVERRLRDLLIGATFVVVERREAVPFGDPAHVGIVPDLIRGLEDGRGERMEQHQ